jgi:hypothetical protein
MHMRLTACNAATNFEQFFRAYFVLQSVESGLLARQSVRQAKRSIGTQRHPASRGQPPC